MKETIVLTNNKNYTALEVVDLFSQYISPCNVEILVNHLTYPELSESIISFTEQDGVLFFDIGSGDFISVTSKK